MNCSTGCSTGPHATFGECLRSKNLKVAYCQSAAGKDATRQRRWDDDLAAYRDAVRQGVQPATTRRGDVDQAMQASERSGVAFRADA